MKLHARHFLRFTVIAMAGFCMPVRADEKPATRPALEQLNTECVALYSRLQGSMVHVQMPTPQWVANAAKENPFGRYKLNEKVKQTLEQQSLSRQAGGNSTQPAASNYNGGGLNGNQGQSPSNISNISGQNAQQNESKQIDNNGQNKAEGYTIIVPQVANDPLPMQIDNRMNNAGKQPAAFASNNIGLVLDDKGHVLVPTFIEREAVGNQPVKLAFGECVVDAAFVGSDQQTSLTVLRLARPAALFDQKDKDAAAAPATPVKLSSARLTEGGLVVMVSPTDGSARLTVWNGGGRDLGIVVTIDGQVAGIARYGQFLNAPACQLIADQIIRHGAVRRATLGVIISQLEPADPARQNQPDLGDKPAMRVDQVIKGSVAEKAGLKPGDLIFALAGEPVHDIPSLSAGIAARSGPTKLGVLREGKKVEVIVELVQR